MLFEDKHTTADRKTASPTTEKDKMLLSNDAFAIGTMIEEVKIMLNALRIKL